MDISFVGSLSICIMILAMLLAMEMGRRLGIRRRRLDPDAAKAGAGAVEGAVFALMGLLIAFTFSGAAARFDARRGLVVEETNDIGTAWLRLDLLPPSAQPSLRDKFRDYVDTRISVYQRLPDIDAAKAELARGSAQQNVIWSEAVTACRESGSQSATMLLLPALNQMIDITATRTMAARMHPPILIYIMLGALILASSLLSGYGMAITGRARDWFHTLAFILVMTLSLYIIIDFEFPHFGFIRIEASEQILVDFRAGMK